MHDRLVDSRNSHELKFSREQGFFDKSIAVRWMILAIFSFSLFAFLHFREVRVEVLEFNSIAPSFIVAQVDFDFLDEEVTIILKQEAMRDIGRIYRISEKEVHKRRLDFEGFLITNQEWRQTVEKSNLEEMYRAGDALEKTLMQVRFTDPRTLQKLKELAFPVEHYLVYTPADVEEAVFFPQQIWDSVQNRAFAGLNLTPNTSLFVIKYFQSVSWKLDEDLPSQRALRKRAQALVPDKYTQINAGSRIIDQGEKVTARHIAMLQAMKNAMGERRNLWHPLTLFGTFMLTAIMAAICIAYFRVNFPQILNSNRKLFLLATVLILTLALSKAIEFFLLNSKNNLIEVVRYPLFVPFAAILLCSLMNAGVATFASGFLAIVLTIGLAFERQGFMVMNLAAALVAILSTRSLRRRKEIFVVCAKAWLCCVAVIFSIHAYQNTLWNDVSFLADLSSTAIFMLLTGVLVVGLLPLLESGFKIMTDVSLMEYMDPNTDLLRRLSIEAPGTYQHSIVVGNLAESAALSIGANGLFCRVATLYHDIGKMATPQYFTENQYGGMNIHQLLTPKESAQVIMAHVSEGVAMARKAGLPEQFIDIIKEHHGTTLVYYFYRKQLDKMGDDRSLVEEKEFRYSGPRPHSKESAIIMIADSLEAASRSLEVINEDTLNQLATRLIKEKAEDAQFDECLLTFEELALVKLTLIKTLVAYGHSRVKYPTRENDAVPTEVS